jgi:hypothetical protein
LERDDMGQVFDGKKIFVITRSHVGYSAYRFEYVEWLEQRVSELEDAKTCREAMEWACHQLGDPNSLREPLNQYVRTGETCADGIDRAHEKVLLLEAEIERLKCELTRPDTEMPEKARVPVNEKPG